MSKTVITYKKEETSYRLQAVIELKNTLGYDLRGLTEALGYTDTEIVRKALLKELPISDEMYSRAWGLLDLSKLQDVRGREQEIRSRVNLITAINKKTSIESLSNRLNKPDKYISNFTNSGKLIGDVLYKELLDIYKDILEAEELEREKKRQANILPIEEVIEELEALVMELEPENKEDETEEELEYRMRKRRLLSRLKRLYGEGVTEVTPNGSGYKVIR